MSSRTQKIIMSLLVVLLVSSTLCLLGGGLYIYKVVKDFDEGFAQHVYVEDTPIGGLTVDEARLLLEEKLKVTNHENKLTLTHKDKKTSVPIQSFNPQYPIEETLQLAYNEGHNVDFFSRYRIAKYGGQQPKMFDMTPTFTEEGISKGLMQHTTAFYEAPVDATLERKNRQFILTEEANGEALDVKETAGRIAQYFGKQQEGEVAVVVKELPAAVTTELLKTVQSPIASFYTSYNNSDKNRNQNLSLAAKKINRVLKPGDIFSLGQQLEPITFDEGYRASKVIVDGKLEEGIGGGVCQIASTLYNAVLLSKLDIVARANHSLPVAYVPLGRDATYATDSIDFRFQNNTAYPVFIESYCENNRVYVNIFSHTTLKEDYDSIKFSSETVKTTEPPAIKIIKDPSLYVDQRIQETAPLQGKTVKLYKLCYKNDALVHKELVNTSYYRARGEVVKVGTKPRPPEPKALESTFSDIGIDSTTLLEQP
ncbi:MAG: VanW family protein [Cellulosilyticaceae bacterium]